jgi:AraC-like DNA-binding protein
MSASANTAFDVSLARASYEPSGLKRAGDSIHIGVGWALFRGRMGDKALHSHEALHVCLADESNVIVDLGENTINASAVAIRSGVRHALREEAGTISILYLEPHGEPARILNHVCGGDGAVRLDASISSAIRNCVKNTLTWNASGQFIVSELRPFLHAPPETRGYDARVALALALIKESIHDSWPLATLAHSLSLSPHKLSDIVKASTGLPLRAHIRWLRLQAASDALAAGSTLYEAALRAGFADATYMVNNFRHVFGSPPSRFFPDLKTEKFGKEQSDRRHGRQPLRNSDQAASPVGAILDLALAS